MISARCLAGDAGPEGWLDRLGWSRPGLAERLELPPLNPEGVADVLIHMGVPLDALGRRVDIVAELHRLTEGDPLLVELYVNDLWRKKETAACLRREDLRQLEPGLNGYFDRWYEKLLELNRTKSDSSEKYGRALENLLGLLGCALGGELSREDIHKLTPPELGLTGLSLDQLLKDLDRFVIGDGLRQGYVFGHPRFADFYYEKKMLPDQRKQCENRYLEYGKKSVDSEAIWSILF